MWRLLSVLALCGISALGADVCRGLPGPPEGSEFRLETLPKPSLSTPFQLNVKPGGPAFRITVRSLALTNIGAAIHAGDIEVARCQDGKRLQSLPIMAWQPIDFGASFQVEDINFDGYLDFSVITEYASKYASRSYWVYDPDSGLFVQNELTRKLSENCLGAAWHGGCYKADSISFDSEKREISTHYFAASARVWDATGGASAEGCPWKGDRYRVENNRLILVHKEQITEGDVHELSCTVTVSDLIAGTMQVTDVRRWRFDIASNKNAGTGQKVTPVISWPKPADIGFGQALSNRRLNATANVPGTLAYTPPPGTVLPVGNGQALSVTFTPSDTTRYSGASQGTTINVSPGTTTGVMIIISIVSHRDANNNIVVQLTLANAGDTAAANFVLAAAKIGSVSGTPLPQPIGTIGPNSLAQATVTVRGSVGAPGTRSQFTATGTYIGRTAGYPGGTAGYAGGIRLP
ncbi:MAG: hypothetical protein WBW33_01205 [Bryobacteraceae bacterium]